MTARTQTLTDFLLAQIAEDEAVARAASGVWCPLGDRLQADPAAGRVFIDPARVLATCAAHRRIVELHYEMDGGAPETYPYVSDDGRTIWPGCAVCDEGSPRRPYCDTLRALAAIYADRPRWREEWAL